MLTMTVNIVKLPDPKSRTTRSKLTTHKKGDFAMVLSLQLKAFGVYGSEMVLLGVVTGGNKISFLYRCAHKLLDTFLLMQILLEQATEMNEFTLFPSQKFSLIKRILFRKRSTAIEMAPEIPILCNLCIHLYCI